MAYQWFGSYLQYITSQSRSASAQSHRQIVLTVHYNISNNNKNNHCMAYTQVNLLAGKPAEDFLSQFYSLRAVPDGRKQKS